MKPEHWRQVEQLYHDALDHPAGERAAFLEQACTGDPALRRETDMDGSIPPPVGSPNYFIGSMDQGGPYAAPQDALTLWKFTVNFVTPASSSFTLANTIPISAYDTIPAFCAGRACVPAAISRS